MTGRFDRLRFLLPVAGLVAAAAAGFALAGYRLNLTASFPPGLYRTTPDGPLVAVCLEGAAAQLAADRGYVRTGVCPGRLEPLMKRITARPGDEVEVNAGGVWVNGQPLANSAPRVLDSQGRPMPSLMANTPGGYRVRLAHDQLWLSSGYNAGSFDSRYFGPVSAGQIKERLSPVWIAFTDRSW